MSPNYNCIVIKIILTKVFSITKSKKALELIIYNNSNRVKNLNIKYKDLLYYLEPLGFGKEWIKFDNIKDDDILNVKIPMISSNKLLYFLSNDIKLVTKQKHTINIEYCFKYDYKEERLFVYDTSNVSSRQIMGGGMFKQNLKDYAVFKFKSKFYSKPDELKKLENYQEYNFLNNQYYLITKEKAIFFIDYKLANIYTLIFVVWNYDELTYKYENDSPKILKIAREIKLKNILDI